MKTILAVSILFSVIALPVLGELTVQDIEKLDKKIQASEDRMKAHMTQQTDILKNHISQEIKTVNVQFTEIDKRISSDSGWTKFLLTIVVAIIGIPTAIIVWRSRKDHTLEKQIETLTEEVETLKQQRIVNP